MNRPLAERERDQEDESPRPAAPQSDADLAAADRLDAERDAVAPFELTVILHRLRRLKAATLLAVALALLIGLTTGYRLSLSPPGVESRQLSYATAALDVVLDTRRSTLSDADSPLEPLSLRSVVLAARLRSDDSQFEIAKVLGVPPDQVAVSSANFGNPRAITTPDEPIQRANTLRFQGAKYQVLIDARGNVPVISVNALAPTVATAQASATAAGRIVERLASENDQGVPDDNRIVAAVGRPSVGRIGEGSTAPTAAVAALLAFIGIMMIVLLLANIFESVGRNRDAS